MARKRSERAHVHVGKASTAVMRGEDDPATWSLEELKRGRRRSKHGGFSGRDPAVVPQAIAREYHKRVLEQVSKRMLDSLDDAVRVLVEIATDPFALDNDKLRAIDMLANRVLGKPAETMKVQANVTVRKWEAAMEDVIILDASPDDDDEPISDEAEMRAIGRETRDPDD